MKLAGYLFLAVVLMGIAVLASGARLWRNATARRIQALQLLASEPPPTSDAELPDPVTRYLRQAIGDAPHHPHVVRLSQEGEFRVSEAEDGWRPFDASQDFTVEPPGFVWDARIAMAPGMPVRVRDSYVGGSGSMQAKLLSLVTLVDERHKEQLDRAALQRYLAEAVWFPTALLPSERLRWQALDAETAEAFLSDGDIEVSVQFRFQDGSIVGVYANRYREVEGNYVLTPWQGRFHSYETREGIRFPTHGEVAWILPEGEYPYWRGRIVDIDFTR